MTGPLLDLGQDWQQQRAQLRAVHRRPPPLVTAGLDLIHDPEAKDGRRVAIQGLALVFGIFPASFAEFLELARSRLRMGSEEARAELQGLLSARVQALWAWMPGLRCDIYAEVDHATEEIQVWRIGPAIGACERLDLATAAQTLDGAFLEGLVLNGMRHWGGAAGLARLVRRFGKQPLLVAAQVAELLERSDIEPKAALVVAQSRWTALRDDAEDAWEDLCEIEHPWVCAQLGRLALRLGLLRAARRLLDRVRQAQAGPTVWGDLAEACDRVDDLPGAVEAATQVVALSADEPALRRLLILHVRSGQIRDASQTLVRLRATGGTDLALVQAGLSVLDRPALPLIQRAQLAGWMGSRTAAVFAAQVPLDQIFAQVRQGRDDQATSAALSALHTALADVLGGDATESVTMAERVALCALPFPGRSASADAGSIAAHALLALRGWAEHAFGPGRIPDTLAVRQALLGLARLAGC